MVGIGGEGFEHAVHQACIGQFFAGEVRLDADDVVGDGAGQALVIAPQRVHRAAGDQPGDVDGEDVDILAHLLVLLFTAARLYARRNGDRRLRGLERAGTRTV